MLPVVLLALVPPAVLALVPVVAIVAVLLPPALGQDLAELY